MSDSLRLLVIGAHPDDAEYKAGGLAALYRKLGHDVRFLSATDGSAGHHQMSGPPLADRRRKEAEAAANRLGLSYEIWDEPDGFLECSLARRERMIRAIRNYRPDLVLTHRPNDYHPDHRATSLLVQDAAYLLTVPAICPDVPHLRRDPVIAYLSDDFSKPDPFVPDVVVEITDAWNEKIDLLHAHESQFYEWLPYNHGYEAEVPHGEAPRRAWLSERMADFSRRLADRHRQALIDTYGPDRGRSIELLEAFEACEYGAPLDEDARARLFPMVPDRRA